TKGAGTVAIVEQAQVGAAAFDFAGEPRLRVSELFGRQRDAEYAGAVMPDDPLGERPPAAADLEHALAAVELEQCRGAVELGLLRALQRVAVGEQRRRVIHAGVEPGPEEIVAEIVMRRDV